MKLCLYVKNNLVAEEEITIPDFGLSFKSRVEIRENIIKVKTRELKNKYAKAIEHYQWEIILVVESGVKEDLLKKYSLKAV